jgi:hypothetical protein
MVQSVVADNAHPLNYAVTVQTAGTAAANVKGVVYSADSAVDSMDAPTCQRTLSDTALTLDVGAPRPRPARHHHPHASAAASRLAGALAPHTLPARLPYVGVPWTGHPDC